MGADGTSNNRLEREAPTPQAPTQPSPKGEGITNQRVSFHAPRVARQRLKGAVTPAKTLPLTDNARRCRS
jgi:hypothetical protein